MKDILSKGLLSESQQTMLVEETLLMPRSAAAQLLWSVQSGDFRDILPTIKIPTLCIGGSQSHLPPECMEWASQQMPKGSFLLLEGSHFMFLEHPEEFNQVAGDFLRKHFVA
jgi:pimeloyl-ACP methyl ester carboxylesterase